MKQEYKDDIKKQCKRNAVDAVDALFDNKLLSSDLKRKDMRAVEELIVLHTYDEIIKHIKCVELLESLTINK